MKKHLVVILFLSMSSAYAALNKWVDEKGKVHYSDLPPPANVQKTTLHFAPPPVVSAILPVSVSAPIAISSPIAQPQP